MMLFQSFKMALKAIAGNKMRSFLTVLGVIIGVMAVVVLVSIGQGANSSVVSSIEGMGSICSVSFFLDCFCSYFTFISHIPR